MRNKLILFTAITGIALLGIMALQAFWLNNLYSEQKQRFKDVIGNALSTVILRTELSDQLLSNIQKYGDTATNFKLNINGALKNVARNNPEAAKQIDSMDNGINIEIKAIPGDSNDKNLKTNYCRKSRNINCRLVLLHRIFLQNIKCC